MLKKLCQCIGLASLILITHYGDLLGGGYDVRMHVPFALHSIVYAQLADILLLGLLLFAVLAPLSRTHFYPWVRLLLAITIPPYLIQRTRIEIPFPITEGLLVLILIVWTAILLLLLLKFHDAYLRLMRVGDFIGIFFAVFCVFSVLELLWIVHWKPGPHEHGAAWATTAQPPREHPRLVWIIFDELSYDQVYGHRARDLALPNFDALRSDSTVFTDAQPIGDKTVKIIPSLLSGHVIDAFDFTFDNRFMVHDAGGHGFQQLVGSETVFADAQRSGWRTAAVGWYNPYCTQFAGAIGDCYWMNFDRLDGPMAQGRSFWQNTSMPLRQLGEQIVAPTQARRDLCTFDVRQHYKTYVDLTQHTEKVLQTDQADLIFLHLPVPHSPNIWSRMRGRYTRQCGSSYLDSLALADQELGSILATLKSSPRWKDTTLIVQGDHSWRIYLWDNEPAWTDEDREASRSGFDPRPAVIIHHAGQTQAEVNATPWSLLDVHAVVERVIHGEAGHY